MFSIFNVGRSFWLGHFKSSLQAEKVGTPEVDDWLYSWAYIDNWCMNEESCGNDGEHNETKTVSREQTINLTNS